ncbi:MAG: DUF7507 domain-containing protein [Rhizobiaceae bacterium]
MKHPQQAGTGTVTTDTAHSEITMGANEMKNQRELSNLRNSRTLAVSMIALITALGAVTPAYADLSNTVTVTGSSPGNTNDVSDNVQEDVDVIDAAPDLVITKSGALTTDTDTDTLGDAGDVVTYTYTVRNDGNITMTTVGITDTHDGDTALGTPLFTQWITQGTSPAASAGDPTITLAPGSEAEFEVTYTITQTDINNGGGTGVGLTVDDDIDNSAVADGSYIDSTQTAANHSSAIPALESIPLDVTRSLLVAKTAIPNSSVGVGTLITYTYTITNNGTVQINDITLADVHSGTGPFTPPDPDTAVLTDNGIADSSNPTTGDSDWDVLGPTDVLTMTATYTTTQADIDAQ